MTVAFAKPRLLFLGTPAFAVSSLQAMFDENRYQIAAVITQPDKPAGRGGHLRASPVKEFARTNSLPVLEPATLKGVNLSSANTTRVLSGTKLSSEFAASLNQLGPIDLAVCVAYGKLIPQALLDFPRLGIINVHGSLLPRWRGAAPIHHTLLAGDTQSGISIMRLEEGLDCGPVYAKEALLLDKEETFGSLHDKLASLGAALLTKTLPQILSETLVAAPQEEVGVTYADKWNVKDMEIKWEEDAQTTIRRIRACAPQPGARTYLDGLLLKVFSAHQVPNQNFPSAAVGSIVEVNSKQLIVSAGSSQYIQIDEMQFPGKKRLPITEVLRGHAFRVGQQFADENN